MKYRVLGVDIDGTLLNRQGQISSGTRVALKQAHLAGIDVILCTGRRFRLAYQFALELGFDVPLIVNGGAIIKEIKTGNTLYCKGLSEGMTRRLLSFLCRYSRSILVFVDRPLEDNFDFLAYDSGNMSSQYRTYLEKNRELYYALQDGELPQELSYLEICVVESERTLTELMARLSTRFGPEISCHLMEEVPVLGTVLEIFPPGTSKWSALLHWASQRNIARRQIVAVGDQMNDLAMVSNAGLGAAMGNAIEVLKQNADRVLPDNDQEGLVELVNFLLKETEETNGFESIG